MVQYHKKLSITPELGIHPVLFLQIFYTFFTLDYH